MKKESLENLTITGNTEGKRSRGKHQIPFLMYLSERMAEQGLRGVVRGQKLLSAKKSVNIREP